VELWHKCTLKLIGNNTGRFIALDEKSKEKMTNRVAQICEELDLHERLPFFFRKWPTRNVFLLKFLMIRTFLSRVLFVK
jgi:hypothetical protein